jgi:hypothetical protein
MRTDSKTGKSSSEAELKRMATTASALLVAHTDRLVNRPRRFVDGPHSFPDGALAFVCATRQQAGDAIRLRHDRLTRSRGPASVIYRAFARRTDELPRFSTIRRAENIELERQAAACRSLPGVNRDAVLSVVPCSANAAGSTAPRSSGTASAAPAAVNARSANISPAEGVFHSGSLPLADGRLRPRGVS